MTQTARQMRVAEMSQRRNSFMNMTLVRENLEECLKNDTLFVEIEEVEEIEVEE